MRKFISSVANPFRNIRWKCNGTWFASQVSSVIFGAYNVVCFTRKMRNNEMPTEFVVGLHWLREREIRYSLWYRFCENTIHLVLWEFGEITNERCEACGKRTKEDAQAFAKELMCTLYISIGKRLFGVCVFLAESEKWNIARYLPISLRYSHEKRLSNKYCAVCCAACWQTRRGNCNRMLIKLVRIIYVWYVRSII